MYNDLRNFVIQDGLISIDQVEACDPDFPSIYYMASKSSTCAYFVCAGGYAVQKFCPLGTRLEDSFYQDRNGEHTVIVSRENATSHTVTNIEGVTKTTPDINTLWSTPTEPLTQHSGHLPSTSDQVTPYVLPDRTPSTPPPPRAPYPRTQTTPYSPPPPRAPHPRTQTTPYAPPPPKTPYTRPTTATRSTANTTPQTPLPAPKTFSNVKETLKIGGICRGRYDERCEQLDSNTACKRNKGIYICECKASYIARGGDECVKKKAGKFPGLV
ncbi:hypothetical protein EB796_006677 [Bugula neritina]|uniref:Uncharacterized protein n=1 Tax=Bugula neritina TaxID=10212 RepID=A0A7J7K8Q8_BUGNE|nr:hypothetical protein EB796_006677 [Bugula neritina]